MGMGRVKAVRKAMRDKRAAQEYHKGQKEFMEKVAEIQKNHDTKRISK